MFYLCPLCQTSLQLNQRSLRCSNNHQFDIAKENYVNLLAVQHKNSKDPGDNKAMMQARRAFLDREHYAPLRSQVVQILQKHLAESTQPNLLDIGCGEGYYTQAICDGFSQCTTYGLDISKAMIRAAAKRYPNPNFVVASSQRLPFSDQQLDAIIRIYAPCDLDEIKRVLKAEGLMLTVTPAPRHLYQLKAMIYDTVRLHEAQSEELAGFECIESQKIHYEMNLNAEDACTLLQMTPFAWRASEAVWAEVKSNPSFSCEADFLVSLYKKVK